MYQSIIPRRTRPITADDFYRPDGTPVLTPTCVQLGIKYLNQWNENIPLLPIQIGQFFQHLPVNGLQFSFRYDGENIFSGMYADSEGVIQNGMFSLDMNKRTHFSSILKVSKKGSGLGRAVGLARLELEHAFGFDSYKFSAGDEDGARYWARRGFEIDDDIDVKRISDRLFSRLYAVEDCLPTDLFYHCCVLAHLSEPDDLLTLANQDYILPETVAVHDFYYESGKRRPLMRQAFNGSYEKIISESCQAIRDLLDLRRKEGRSVTLSEYLFYKSEWEAKLNFADDRQMAKVEKHSGSFKTLTWAPDTAPKDISLVLQPRL